MIDKHKIPLEEIVNPKEIMLIRSIECPIDNMVPLEHFAVVCKKCETVYCKDCIEVWKKNSNICPMRCSPMQLIKVDLTIVGQQLQKIRIKCSNEVFGCEAKLLTKDIKKHENECPYRQEECSSCSVKKCYYLMGHHLLKECESLKIQCFICSNKYHLGDIREHIKKCQEVNTYCDICSTYHSTNLESKYKCRLNVTTCSKCSLPEINYIIGTQEHICLNEKSQSTHNSLNNYLLQLSVRVQMAMDKAMKDRYKINNFFLQDFHEKIKNVQRVYFNKLYQLSNKTKKVHEDYKRRIQIKNSEIKENITKLKQVYVNLQNKIESKLKI
jgi:hypothetical protein